MNNIGQGANQEDIAELRRQGVEVDSEDCLPENLPTSENENQIPGVHGEWVSPTTCPRRGNPNISDSIILAKEPIKKILLSYVDKELRLRMRTASLKTFPQTMSVARFFHPSAKIREKWMNYHKRLRLKIVVVTGK